MPYITPPPVLPSDVGTDFLLDIDIEDEQDVATQTQELGEEANQQELVAIETAQMGW